MKKESKNSKVNENNKEEVKHDEDCCFFPKLSEDLEENERRWNEIVEKARDIIRRFDEFISK